jgi:hypothetical protein
MVESRGRAIRDHSADEPARMNIAQDDVDDLVAGSMQPVVVVETPLFQPNSERVRISVVKVEKSAPHDG